MAFVQGQSVEDKITERLQKMEEAVDIAIQTVSKPRREGAIYEGSGPSPEWGFGANDGVLWPVLGWRIIT